MANDVSRKTRIASTWTRSKNHLQGVWNCNNIMSWHAHYIQHACAHAHVYTHMHTLMQGWAVCADLAIPPTILHSPLIYHILYVTKLHRYMHHSVEDRTFLHYFLWIIERFYFYVSFCFLTLSECSIISRPVFATTFTVPILASFNKEVVHTPISNRLAMTGTSQT